MCRQLPDRIVVGLEGRKYPAPQIAGWVAMPPASRRVKALATVDQVEGVEIALPPAPVRDAYERLRGLASIGPAAAADDAAKLLEGRQP